MFVPTRPKNVNPLLEVEGGQLKWQHTTPVRALGMPAAWQDQCLWESWWASYTKVTWVVCYLPSLSSPSYLLPLSLCLSSFCSEVRFLIRVKWMTLQMWRGFCLSLLIDAFISSLFISFVYGSQHHTLVRQFHNNGTKTEEHQWQNIKLGFDQGAWRVFIMFSWCPSICRTIRPFPFREHFLRNTLKEFHCIRYKQPFRLQDELLRI